MKERKAMNEQQVLTFVRRLRSAFYAFERIPIPTIAALDGSALGGGLELALCCDMRVGSEHCVVGLPETRIAIIPGAGGTQRLPRLIGSSRAKDLIMTGRRLKAYEAYEYGLLDRYTHQGKKALQEALEMAHLITQGGPLALEMAKEAIDKGRDCITMKEALQVEDDCYAKVVPTKDRLEALQAFSEKRTPIFKGE